MRTAHRAIGQPFCASLKIRLPLKPAPRARYSAQHLIHNHAIALILRGLRSPAIIARACITSDRDFALHRRQAFNNLAGARQFLRRRARPIIFAAVTLSAGSSQRHIPQLERRSVIFMAIFQRSR